MTGMSTYSMYEFPERDELEMGMDSLEERALIDYHDALDAAEAAGESWFSFDAFMARCEENRRVARLSATTVPASDDADDNIPF